jgi:hypothetical protein
LFPIFIEYWTIVALDSKLKKVVIYNVSQPSVILEIFECVKKFVKKELKIHEKKSIEGTGWRELRQESVIVDDIQDFDSAAFMLRVAYKIAISNKAAVSSDVLNDFRYNLLVMLFKHGVQASFNVKV